VREACDLGWWWGERQGNSCDWHGLGLSGVYVVWDATVIKTGFFLGSAAWPPADPPPRAVNPLPRRDPGVPIRPAGLDLKVVPVECSCRAQGNRICPDRIINKPFCGCLQIDATLFLLTQPGSQFQTGYFDFVDGKIPALPRQNSCQLILLPLSPSLTLEAALDPGDQPGEIADPSLEMEAFLRRSLSRKIELFSVQIGLCQAEETPIQLGVDSSSQGLSSKATFKEKGLNFPLRWVRFWPSKINL